MERGGSGGEMWRGVGVVGRCGEGWDGGGEMWRGVRRCGEGWGDVERGGEMWRGVGRCGEGWGDVERGPELEDTNTISVTTPRNIAERDTLQPTAQGACKGYEERGGEM